MKRFLFFRALAYVGWILLVIVALLLAARVDAALGGGAAAKALSIAVLPCAIGVGALAQRRIIAHLDPDGTHRASIREFGGDSRRDGP